MNEDLDTKPTILIADDEEELLNFLSLRLSREPWTIRTAKDGEEALDVLLTREVDVAVLDLKMPKLDALNTSRPFRSRVSKRTLSSSQGMPRSSRPSWPCGAGLATSSESRSKQKNC